MLNNWTANPVPGSRGEDGMDLRGLTPYGVKREFTIVDYDGYDQISTLQIQQQFQSYRAQTATGDVSFDMEHKNIEILADAIGLNSEDYEDATGCRDLLDIFSKHIVDNFELKNQWPAIYKASKVDRAVVEMIKGPHYGKKLPVNDAYGYVEIYSNSYNGMHITLDAEIYDINMFDISKKYSLTLALRNTKTGELIILHKDYKELMLYGNEPNRYYVFGATSSFYHLNPQDVLRINKAGEYDLTFLITMQKGEEDVVVFDTLSTLLLRRYYGLKLDDFVDEQTGIKYKYSCSGRGGRFLLNVVAIEPQE